jgi:hypothetical protein
VSWAAIFSVALAAVSVTLVLLALGAGLGLSSISPWPNSGASVATFTIMTAIGLIVVQWLAAAIGGFLTGRLRTKWVAVHVHEVFFRDTAHGFLAWAVALVITAAFLASAAASMVGAPSTPSPDGTGGTTGAKAQAREFDPNAYFIDTLLRSDPVKRDADSTSVYGEVERILANALRHGDVPAEDKSYLAQLVSARTGLSQADADKRVSEVFARAQQTADTTRKIVAHSLLWAFLALLIGAFCASFAATIGGRQRDHVVIV